MNAPSRSLARAPHLGSASFLDADTEHFGPADGEAARAYLEHHGYVVIRGLISAEFAGRVNEVFSSEVRSYTGYLYRQTTCNPEKHRFSDSGFMMNPLLNVQDLPSKRFPQFRSAALDVITGPETQDMVTHLLRSKTKLVQSMYFEGNPATWAHQDTYYLDSEHIGTMVAGWFATEDIGPGAGRFFVYPGSHQLDMFRNGGKFDVAFNHPRYKQLVLDTIAEHGLQCKAPALAVGDALFWNAKTIHGSIATENEAQSRRSLTAHFIPEQDRFLQHQSRIRGLSMSSYKGYPIHSPKSLDNPVRKAVLKVETTVPKQFAIAKKLATKALITVNSVRRK